MSSENKNKKRKMTMVMKKHNDKGVDRLSALPDSLLIHLLCFVSEPAGLHKMWYVKKTAVTSVLSERWRYLWAELPVLSFREKSIDSDKIRKFVDMVSRTLSIRTAEYLEKFYVDFRFSQRWAVSVDDWLEFASKSKAKVVSLAPRPREKTSKYVVPDMFYVNSWLRELEFAYCTVAPQRRVEWRYLSRLEFCGMELKEHVIENLLSGCPVLYSLGVNHCWGFNLLNITSASIGELRVWDGSIKDVDQALEISAPDIHYLDIKSIGKAKNRKILLRNIPCVVKSFIDIRPHGGFKVATPEDKSDAKEWIEATRHIPELHLTEHLFMIVSEVIADGWQISQSKRVSLEVETCALRSRDEATILSLVSLLESSPQLEKFEVYIWAREYDSLDHQPLRNDDFSCCDYLHLKTVVINCAAEDDVLMDVDTILLLARIVLRRATVLEKMTILVDVDYRPELKKMAEEVKLYPRSSEQAQVLIRDPPF